MRRISVGKGILRKFRAAVIESLETRRLLTTYVVNVNTDGVALSGDQLDLRTAIQDVNTDAGPDVIQFDIGGGGATTIALTSALPTITTSVTIDGTTQPGYAGVPLIALDGTSAGANVSGLTDQGGSTTIEGLTIVNFTGNGVELSGDGDVVEACDIGVLPDGTAGGNGGDGVGIDVPINMIPAFMTVGGSVAGEGNVISGNTGAGVYCLESGDTPNIQGNIIGLEPDGLTRLANGNYGIYVKDTGRSLQIGGETAASGNVISGNSMGGIEVGGGVSATIEGNTIGLGADGSTVDANEGPGISVDGEAQIGGIVTQNMVSVARGNVISGNNGNGIIATGGISVFCNLIGTDATGTLARPNSEDGIKTTAEFATIGGVNPILRNVISGNKENGIETFNSTFSPAPNYNYLIQNNYIGTDITGTLALGNGNSGIQMFQPASAVIGGVGVGNIISDNENSGINAVGLTATIQSNLIGTDVNGAPLGTQFVGIDIYDTAANSIVGGSSTDEANTIVARTYGIAVGNGAADTGSVDNLIRLNSITSATGIQLNSQGANDPGDGDSGPNDFQNYPVVASALSSASGTTINGVLNTNPGTALVIDFYSNPSSAGLNDEGVTYIGSVGVATDAGGNAPFSVTVPSVLAGGSYVTATASTVANAPNGETSQFSPPVVVVAAKPTISIGNVTQNEGNSGTTIFAFPVSLSAASSSDITVHYATADGTATTADNDYVAASNTLTIPAGFTTGTIDISVIGDTKVEPNETFTVALSAPIGATLGTAIGTGTILNDDTAAAGPVISIGNVTMKEGNSGTTVFIFPVTISPASTVPVTFTFTTADGTATTADHDYVGKTQTVTVIAGATSTTKVAIVVNGDTKVEPDETFTVTLSHVTGATLGNAVGTATIQNDDGTTPPPPLFSAHVNFEPAGQPVPSGYVADTGAVFATHGSLSYGWSGNATSDARIRHLNSDLRLDTQILMQLYGSFSWSINVPDGTYSVHLEAGDPSAFNSVYKIDVNNVLVVNGTPTSANRFVSGTQTITVSDGKLTITNGAGSSNDKVDYIDITETAAAAVMLAQPATEFASPSNVISSDLLAAAPEDVLTEIYS